MPHRHILHRPPGRAILLFGQRQEKLSEEVSAWRSLGQLRWPEAWGVNARSQDVEQWRDLLHALMDVVCGPGHEELNRSLTAWLQYVARGDDSPTRYGRSQGSCRPPIPYRNSI